jgi:signal transduction histidine kinase
VKQAWRAVRARPRLEDSLLAAALALTGVVGLFAAPHESGTRSPGLLAAALVLLSTLPLAERRRHPVAVLACCAIAIGIHDVANFPSTTGELGLLVAFYSVAVHARQPVRSRAAVGFFVFLTVFITLGLVFDHGNVGIGNLVGNTVVFATAYVVGDNVRRRRERVADLEERARRLEHERELEARDAAARERAAIARELHDVVAHSVTLMVVQAGAARRVLASDPERAEKSLRVVEETGRSSLVELRRILGVLREGDDAPALAPQPGLDRVDELVRAELASPVELVTSGAPRPLPTLVDVAAYRIVQEALTNVRKHADGARVHVRLDYGDDEIEIRVDDDGAGARRLPRSTGTGGHGLTGMRERAALCGGVLHAGPRSGGGWSVVARLPYSVGAAV